MPKTLYIAGPMTGHIDYNRRAFFLASARLDGCGYRVLNPANLPPGMIYRQYLAIGTQMVLSADGIALLPGWENSPGATAEVALAKAIDIPANPLDDWFPPPPEYA